MTKIMSPQPRGHHGSLHVAMSKRYWFAGIALGLVLAGLLFWPFVDAAVPRLDSLPQQTLAAPNCRYDEAVRAEQDAYRQTEAANKIPDARLGAGGGSSAYEAAKRGTEQAKECEERARAWSDLWAQWQSARAASVTTELTRWGILGTGLEILVLLAALAAASWAAWETRKANKIALQAFYEGGASISIDKATMGFAKEKLGVLLVSFLNSSPVGAETFSVTCTLELINKATGEKRAIGFIRHPTGASETSLLGGVSRGTKWVTEPIPDDLWQVLETRALDKIEVRIQILFAFTTLGRRLFRSVELRGDARYLHDNDHFPLEFTSDLKKLKLVEEK